MTTCHYQHYLITIKPHHNSRRLRLHVSPEKGIEVTCPPQSSARQLQQFVIQQSSWLEQHRDYWQPAYQPLEVPQSIILKCPSQTYSVVVAEQSLSRRLRIVEAQQQLTIIGSRQASENIIALRRWLIRKASTLFHARLAELSQQTDLTYKGLTIKNQRSRWGSCTSKGNITLNCRLLFFKPSVVDYVIIHELAHTQHMNHSARFWQLVERHCPDYKTALTQLKSTKNCVPDWVRATV